MDVRRIIENTTLGSLAGKRDSGSTNTDIVSNLDFAQTFLELAQAKVPSDMQGRSLVPLLKGETPADWRKSFYYHYYENPGAHNVARHYGVTNGRYKLVRYYALEGQRIDDWELFDLKSDPNELTNVYGSTDLIKIQKELEDELSRLRALYQVPDDHDPGRARKSKPQRQPKSTVKPKA